MRDFLRLLGFTQSPEPRRGPFPWGEGVRLTSPQLGLLTIGQVEQILSIGSQETHDGFLALFSPLAQLGSTETARAFSLLAADSRTNAAGGGCVPDWNLFFGPLKREEVAETITEQTTLRRLSELLWERHTAP